MSTAVLTNRLELTFFADAALRMATRFWFVVTIISQLIFAFAVASFYGLTTLRGDVTRWGKFISHGFVSGDSMGNFAVAMHVASAAVIMLAGAVQLVPQVRGRFPVFHRWNGRLYMLAAVAASVAGLYMMWFRRTVGDLPQHLGSSLAAVLIWLFAGLALRYALARDFSSHRRWALRLFLVVSAAWFFRLSFFLTLLIFQGPVGFDPTTFRGPLLTYMSFAQYLVPLAVLEIYFWAQDYPSSLRRMATAALLFVLTLGMVAGTFAVGAAIWVPQVKAAFDPRKSIAETLSVTIASRGITAAEQQYRELKASQPTTYDFDETELNNLGYQLLRIKKFDEAIRVFQLNIEAYPKSGNVYDSLGEAYMDEGHKVLAVANYKKSLEMNPKNRGAVIMIQKLEAQ